MMQLFNTDHNWYKGNLHTHTNISDGLLPPEETVELYKDAGYNFMAITDHNLFYEGREEDNFTILSGTEIHINDFVSRKAFHIVGIDMEGRANIPPEPSPQDLVDAIIEQKGLAILAHPAWSLLTHADVMDLKNCMGIEIWNTVSEVRSNRGCSANFIDTIASKGYIKPIFAVDDTHFYSDDLFGGYIMLNSPSLRTKDIVENIKLGNFYASQGPEIKQITLESDTIYIETSPVSQISFMSDNFYDDKRVVRAQGQPIDSATYKFGEKDNWVRIECLDGMGKKAWSQFIVL